MTLNRDALQYNILPSVRVCRLGAPGAKDGCTARRGGGSARASDTRNHCVAGRASHPRHQPPVVARAGRRLRRCGRQTCFFFGRAADAVLYRTRYTCVYGLSVVNRAPRRPQPTASGGGPLPRFSGPRRSFSNGDFVFQNNKK